MALIAKNKLQVLGIMNGTSLDGVDFVLTEITKQVTKTLHCRYKAMQSFVFPSKLKNKLQLAVMNQMNVEQLALLHHELGRFYAQCFKKLKFSPKLKKMDVIGLHGQTVFHKGRVASLQIGESSYLAYAANCPVISDFRAADIALGGEGAPIATFFHQQAFGHIQKKLAVHNLGGISNLTLLSRGKVIQGFDTGPANMLMDLEIQRSSKGKILFDKNGTTAKKGTANLALVNKMLSHSFFKKSAPKSCGREEFGISFLNKFDKGLKLISLEDRLATLTEFIAETISYSYKHLTAFIPTEIIFCGGGANNVFLLSLIKEKLPLVKISTVVDYQWSEKSIEGAAFALLAAAKVWNIPSNIPASTGAAKKIVLGKITSI